jgi:hypothetical protein
MSKPIISYPRAPSRFGSATIDPGDRQGNTALFQEPGFFAEPPVTAIRETVIRFF